MIKAVAQAIPTYSMSCFKLPKGLCEHLTSLLRNFWWGYKDGKRKTCWVARVRWLNPSLWADWVFVIWSCLTLRFWPSKFGESYKN